MKFSVPKSIRSLSGAFNKTTAFSNGAELSLDLDPFDSVVYIPDGENGTAPSTFSGTARVGHGSQEVHYTYILDTSWSTGEQDGNCGTILDCMIDFFELLHQEIDEDGSAKFVSFIEFDDDAHIVDKLHNPSNFTFKNQTDDGITVCCSALEKATEVINDPLNTADTNIVIFAGDGYCNGGYNLTECADALGSTGAIVHSVAVGDEVDCNPNRTHATEYTGNFLSDIPRNGGHCIDLESPDDHADVVQDILGSWLESIQIKIDQGEYIDLDKDKGEISKELPQEGVATVTFAKEISGLQKGSHMICARAAGTDSTGDEKQIEDCTGILVQETSWWHLSDDQAATWDKNMTIETEEEALESSVYIFLSIFLCVFVLLAGFCLYRCHRRKNAASIDKEQAVATVLPATCVTSSQNGLNDLELNEDKVIT